MSTVTKAASSAEAAPREKLAAAIESRKAAEAALKNAAEAHARAKVVIDQCEAELEHFAGLDRKIDRARAELIKEGRPEAPLPLDLVRHREQRDALNQRAMETRGALGVLNAEHETAKQTLAEVEQAARIAAWEVIASEAGRELAGELTKLKRRTWRLGGLAAALYQQVRVITQGSAHPALNAAMAEVNRAAALEAPVVVVGSPTDPTRQGSDLLVKVHATLLDDADAPFEWKA